MLRTFNPSLISNKIEDKYGALRNLVPCVQFKKREKHHGGVLLLKVTLLYGCFSHFLYCTNGTKSRNAPQISDKYTIA